MYKRQVQLGATVDYAILFANRYFENRTSMVKSEAAFRTIQGLSLIHISGPCRQRPDKPLSPLRHPPIDT